MPARHPQLPAAPCAFQPTLPNPLIVLFSGNYYSNKRWCCGGCCWRGVGGEGGALEQVGWQGTQHVPLSSLLAPRTLVRPSFIAPSGDVDHMDMRCAGKLIQIADQKRIGSTSQHLRALAAALRECVGMAASLRRAPLLHA